MTAITTHVMGALAAMAGDAMRIDDVLATQLAALREEHKRTSDASASALQALGEELVQVRAQCVTLQGRVQQQDLTNQEAIAQKQREITSLQQQLAEKTQQLAERTESAASWKDACLTARQQLAAIASFRNHGCSNQ